MKLNRWFALLLGVLILVSSGTVCAGETYKIGVLAKNGPVKALQMWKATGDYLTAKIPGETFDIVPLGFDEVYKAVETGRVDFFLVNSSMFVTAKVRYGASAVATMVNARQGQPLKSFGGVIFTQVGNAALNTLQDLKGKRFMAVEEASFGGWQMAYKALLDAGVDPYRDFAKLEFGGKHDGVVYAVLNGIVDAGTVRTDTLERMAAAGEIDMAEFKILNPRKEDGFPFVCSTVLYPEWPLAKIKKTPEEIARKVAQALTQLPANDPAAKNASVVGWVEALDYAPVEALQKSLKVEAYAVAK